MSAATVASTTRRAAAGLGGFRELVRGAIAAAEDQADHVCVVVESLMAASRLARSANVGTGTERGTYRVTNTEIWSSTVVDRGYRVYFGGQDGHVYGVSPGDVVLLDVDLGAPIDSYPALSGDGMLIVGAANGTLAAIG